MQNFPGVRVLLVEDEPLIALEMQDMLAELGCEVVASAGRLKSALEHAEKLEFDVAVLDVNLGADRVDDAADQIEQRHIPIIYTTGNGFDGVPRATARATVSKPFDSATLAAALARALGKN